MYLTNFRAGDKIYTGFRREPDDGTCRVVGPIDSRRRVVRSQTTAVVGLAGPPTADADCRARRRQMSVPLTADVGLSGPSTADVWLSGARLGSHWFVWPVDGRRRVVGPVNGRRLVVRSQTR